MSKNQKLAETYYRKFANVEGNQYIASLYALKKILDLVAFNRPKKILEVGLGIGSISFSIIEFLKAKNADYIYHGTETNEFCLNELPKNLEGNFGKLKIYPELKDLNKEMKYDFVIVDGSDDSLDKISEIIAERGVIYIEGDRKLQQDRLLKFFPKSVFAQTISNYKNPEWGPATSLATNWAGGGKLIYINPTPKQKRSYMIEKLRTYIRYKGRKFSLLNG